jgi:predicted nucleotidyltransferase
MRRNAKDRIAKLGVSVVYIFGSKAVGRGSSLSDVDIGVVLKDSVLCKEARSVYQSLFEIFSDLYPKSKVDIVLLQAAPIPLQYAATKEGRLLFEVDPRTTVEYENRVVNEYLDFEPTLDYFDEIATTRYGKA